MELVTRRIRVERRVGHADFRTLVGFRHELFRVFVHDSDVIAAEVHNVHGQAARGRQARQGRFREGHDVHFRMLGGQGVYLPDRIADRIRPLVVFLHHDRQDAGARFRRHGQDIEPVNGNGILHAVDFRYILGQAGHGLDPAVGRSAFLQAVGH